MPLQVSCVIPCYNSAEMIGGVVLRLMGVLKEQRKCEDYEIILVDDCSADGTADAIRRLCGEYSNVRGLSFSKNFGQQSALMAGFAICSGDVIVCLDDDGQTPPEDVPRLLAKVDQGFDLVYAHYPQKRHSGFRNFGSWVNEKMAQVLIGKPKDVHLSSFYAVKRFLVEEAIRHTTPYPYIPGLFLQATSRIANIPVEHHERLSGASGYNMRKLVSLWLNGFTAFSVKPLRVASIIGIILSIVGLLMAVFIVVRKMIEPAIAAGWTSSIASTLVVGGLILFVLGIIGEYIGRMYITVNQAPQYVVRASFNCSKSERGAE